MVHSNFCPINFRWLGIGQPWFLRVKASVARRLDRWRALPGASGDTASSDDAPSGPTLGRAPSVGPPERMRSGGLPHRGLSVHAKLPGVLRRAVR